MRKINDRYKFTFITEDKKFGLIDINYKTRGFYINKLYGHEDGRSVFTVTLDSSKIVNKKGNTIMQIHFELDHIKNFKSILLHSQSIPHMKEMNMIDFKITHNYTLVVTKTKRSYLGPPYSQCSHYRSDTKRPFNALSHMQCYRHCLRTFAQNDNRLNCTRLFIDDIITELDLFSETTVFCKYDKLSTFNEWINNEGISKCHHLCPNDCLTVDYSYEIQRTDSEINLLFETSNRSEVSIVWDSRQPMLSYIEESVLSFTDYLVNCGGLLGLWFGTNANDLFIRLIKTKILFKLWSRFKTSSRQLYRYIKNE